MLLFLLIVTVPSSSAIPKLRGPDTLKPEEPVHQKARFAGQAQKEFFDQVPDKTHLECKLNTAGTDVLGRSDKDKFMINAPVYREVPDKRAPGAMDKLQLPKGTKEMVKADNTILKAAGNPSGYKANLVNMMGDKHSSSKPLSFKQGFAGMPGGNICEIWVGTTTTEQLFVYCPHVAGWDTAVVADVHACNGAEAVVPESGYKIKYESKLFVGEVEKHPGDAITGATWATNTPNKLTFPCVMGTALAGELAQIEVKVKIRKSAADVTVEGFTATAGRGVCGVEITATIDTTAAQASQVIRTTVDRVEH